MNEYKQGMLISLGLFIICTGLCFGSYKLSVFFKLEWIEMIAFFFGAFAFFWGVGAFAYGMSYVNDCQTIAIINEVMNEYKEFFEENPDRQIDFLYKCKKDGYIENMFEPFLHK